MSKSRFTQADVTRALKGANKAGLGVVSCKIDASGDISIKFKQDEEGGPSPLEDWMERRRARTTQGS